MPFLHMNAWPQPKSAETNADLELSCSGARNRWIRCSESYLSISLALFQFERLPNLFEITRICFEVGQRCVLGHHANIVTFLKSKDPR